jgi:hypothetical protein
MATSRRSTRSATRSKPGKAKSKPERAPAPVVAAIPEIPAADLCQSCGKRPGKKAAIRGQLIGAQLCDVCAAIRKERIRLNRAAMRHR